MRVHAAVFHKQNKQKGNGHSVRCIQRKRGSAADRDGEIVSALEIGNIDSVDKVYRIITEHMKLGVSIILLHCSGISYDGFQSNFLLLSSVQHEGNQPQSS